MMFDVVPAEIKRQGKEAIKKYLTELRKGKIKMPRCKLMILGEAGVGKTSLLSLLTGEPFNPEHNETEGVDTDFVCTTTIYTDSWEKRALKYYLLDEEYKNIAAKILAKVLPDSKPSAGKLKRREIINVPHGTLKQQYDTLVKKYTQPPLQPTVAVAKPKPTSFGSRSFEMGSYFQPPISAPFQYVQPTPPPLIYQPPPPARQLTTVPAPQPIIVPASSLQTTRKEDVHPTPALSTVVHRHEQLRPVTPPPPLPSQNVLSGPDSTEKDIFKRATKLKKQNLTEIPKFPLKFSSFDFAGQDHYKPMHHCFISSRAIYVVAFNVRHLLDEQQRSRCIEELKFWINTIHIYTDAKVVMVGTHRGPYTGHSDLSIEQDNYIKTIMKEQFDKKYYAEQLKFFDKKSIIATVENSIRGDDSKRGSGADVVREKLSSLGDDHPGNKDDLPISYLQLELHIFKERDQYQNSLVPREEVNSWAKLYGIDDPSVPLSFFHDIGTIVDPSKLIH